jgi:hypothetical protein
MNEEFIIRINDFSKIDTLSKSEKIFDIKIKAKEVFYDLDWGAIEN